MRHDHANRSTSANAALATLRAITFCVALVCACSYALGQDVNFAPSQQNGAQAPSARPAQGQASGATATTATSPSPNVAEGVLKSYYQINASANALGEPLALRRALYGSYHPSDRLRKLVAYWDFSYKYAYLNLCLAYQADVKACVDKISQKYGGNAATEAAELLAVMTQIAEERLASARLNFVQAQYNFDAAFTTPAGRRAAIERAQTAGKNVGQGDAILYVPATAPATSAYNTRFDQLAQMRVMSPEAARLNSQIPLLYETLQKRATLAARVRALLERDFKSSTATDDALFNSLENDFDAKVETLKAAARYNQAIAAYVAQTVPATIQGDAFLTTINQRVAEQESAAGSGGAANGSATNGAAQPTNRPATSTFLWNLPGLAPYSNGGYAETSLANSTLGSAEAAAYDVALNLTVPTYSLAMLGYKSNANADAQTTPKLLTVGYVVPVNPTLVAETQQTNVAQTTPVPTPAAAPQSEPTPAVQPEQAATPQPEPTPTPAPAPTPAPEPAQDAPPPPAPANDAPKPNGDEEKKEPAKPDPPKEEPLSAQAGSVLPSELTSSAQDVVFPIVVFITGYEQRRVNAPLEKKELHSSDQDAPDGAFLFNRKLDLVAALKGILESVCDEFDAIVSAPREDEERAWIVRGQEPTPPNGTAPRANAPGGENEQAIAQRAQELGRALFAVPIVAAGAQVKGEEERLFALQETLQRANAYAPSTRALVVREYWKLFAAVAKLRVEETMLQTYVALYEKSSGSEREERALAVALEAQARVAEARAVKRGVQTNLLRIMALTQASSAYPLPSTQPFCGVRFNLGAPAYPNAETLRVGALIQERLRATQTLGAAVRSPSELLNIDLTNITDSNFDVALAALAKKRERTIAYIEQIIQLNFAIAEYVAYYPGNVSNDRFVDAIIGR